MIETIGILDDNPIELFFHGYLKEWFNSLALIDWIRAPMIYVEYLVVLMMELNTKNRDENRARDFDSRDPQFIAMLFALGFPFIWISIFLLTPFL